MKGQVDNRGSDDHVPFKRRVCRKVVQYDEGASVWWVGSRVTRQPRAKKHVSSCAVL